MSLIKSERSKRRKLKEELNVLQRIYCSSDIQSDNINDELNLNSYDCILTQTVNTSQISSTRTCVLPEPFPQNLSVTAENKTENSPSSISPNKTINNLVPFDNFKKDSLFIDNLSLWAIKCNVPHNTLNKLLQLMKKYETIDTKNLPRDSRTLLATPQSTGSQLRSVIPGQYFHFGLIQQINKFAPDYLTEIKVVIGIDGLPLAKSCNNQLWPILAYIVNPKTEKNVFPIGVYYGKSKPNDSNDFLKDFISEAKELLTNAGQPISNFSRAAATTKNIPVMSHADFQAFVINILTKLKFEVSSMSTTINANYLAFEAFCKNIGQSSALNLSNNLQQSFDISDIFPLCTEEQLNNVEEKLKLNGDFKLNMIEKLSLFVGIKNVGERVRRLMTRMFSDELLQNYSLLGFKKKNRFSDLLIYRLIIDAIRVQPKFSNVLDKEIDVPLATWLSHAKFRIKDKHSLA